MFPHPRIDAVRGCVAVERGPLVYCFEHVDQAEGADLDDLALVGGTPLADSPATLAEIGGTVVVDWQRARRRAGRAGGAAVTAPPPAVAGRTDPGPALTATAVPYFQWDNRDGRAHAGLAAGHRRRGWRAA